MEVVREAEEVPVVEWVPDPKAVMEVVREASEVPVILADDKDPVPAPVI